MSDRLTQAYRGRRVLVTGHTGFKGAWLCAWLLELGAEPIGYSLGPPTDPSLFEAIGLDRRMDDRRGDVRDAAAVAALVRDAAADVVVHMAAQPIVRHAYDAPVETFETNVMGTVNVLEGVRRAGRPAVVIVVTSDKCYAHGRERRRHEETDPLGGADPYSASKGAAEIVVASYRRSFFSPAAFADHGVALASGRAGNVLGGGDWAADRIVPDAVRALRDGRPIGVRHPAAIRPWQHVLDALSGYLWLGARLVEGAPEFADAWNFGPEPGTAASVRELVERILKAWGHGQWRDLSDPGAPPEAAFLELSIEKARSRLGWRPIYGLDEAIENTVQWYRDAESRADPFAFSVEQIRQYRRRARHAGAAWAAG
jgi:CDP-glucose 4,6-dehydratase